MAKKHVMATKKRSKRNIKVKPLNKPAKQMSKGELKAVEGGGVIADLAAGVGKGFESAVNAVASGVVSAANAVSSVASSAVEATKK